MAFKRAVRKSRRPAAQPSLSVALFGGPRILDRRGDAVPIASRKARALLALLATDLNRTISRSKLAGLLWDRAADGQARKSLRQELSVLSAALAFSPDAIEATRDTLRLRASAASTDLERLAGGDIGDPARFNAPFLESLDGLSEAFDEWLYNERAAKAEIVRQWHEDRLARLSAENAPAPDQVRAARQMLAFDLAYEQAWRILIGGLADIGDLGQALREYRACWDALDRTLDAEPSAETKALWREISHGASAGGVGASAARPLEAFRRDVVMAERQASIAVLPFIRLSDEPRLTFLANGMLEGVIHVLSGIGDLFVISRGSVLKYADARTDPREAGEELGVRYILSGTICGHGRKVAIYLELSETATGRVLWTDRMRVGASNVFETQDAVSADVVAAIAPSVRANELARARRKAPANLTAYDMLLQALDRLYMLKPRPFDEAGAFLHRAMELDEGFAAVRSHAATWYSFRVAQGWSKRPETDSATAAELSSAALTLDRNDAIALSIQGQVLSFTRRDYGRAREYLDRALRVGPSCHMAWTLSSATHGWTGDGARAVEHAERALRLSPFDPFAFFAEHMLSQGYYVGGKLEKAIFWGRRAADRNGRLTSNLRTLTAALVAAGEIEAAKRTAARVLSIEPKFDLERFRARTPFHSDIRDEHVERLREAGLS